MTMPESESLHRTLKIEMDDGRATTYEEADSLTRTYRLQVAVGADVDSSPTRQAMLLTAVNAGVRAFRGGVVVCTGQDPVLTTPWAEGKRLSAAVKALGASVATHPSEGSPTIVIGRETSRVGTVVLHPTWAGWSGGVVEETERRLRESPEFPLAGILAGALAVSEAFQFVRGNQEAGRRDVGLSLWRPDLDWRNEEAYGGPCEYLPAQWWLLGLGHLGQAYAWAIASLPFADRSRVHFVLQDIDYVVEANASTGLLVPAAHPRERKTRMVARRLEALGVRTAIVERRFDSDTRRRPEEPGLALAGFDDPAPRRALELAGFDRIVDVGLGSGPRQFLDILVHSFPASHRAETAWPEHRSQANVGFVDRPAYQHLIETQAELEGVSREAASCGVTELAGRTAGAAFVGAAAATLAIAEPLRILNGGASFELISAPLQGLDHRQAVLNPTPVHPLAAFLRSVVE